MADTIGPDGLTHEERHRRERLADDFLARWTSNYAAKVLETLAAERLAHAAEKAAHAETRAERDLLRGMVEMLLRTSWHTRDSGEADGSREKVCAHCWGSVPSREQHTAINHEPGCPVALARALLGKVKP